MGRKQTNPVGRMFFVYSNTTESSKCQILNCPYPMMKGRHSKTLEKHIEMRHPDSYRILLKEKEKMNTGESSEDEKSTPEKRLKIGPLDNIVRVTQKSLHIRMDQYLLIKACTELVTINGRPLSIFKDSGMKKILKPITNAIGGNFAINPQNIRMHIIDEAEYIVHTIKNEVHNRLLCLKMDCVTRLNRSLIGINVQYQVEGKLVIRTLAMSHLTERHTSNYLKNMVLKALDRYDITADQIYSCTVDNGANMIKMVRQIAEQNELDNEYIETSESEDINEEVDSEDNNEDNSEDDAFQNSTETELESDTLQDHVANTLQSTKQGKTHCFRCSAHTIQLCVYDGLNKTKNKDILDKACKIVKKLRTSTVATMLVKSGLKTAILDCQTRWNSIYDMLHHLCELKTFCRMKSGDIPELEMSNNDWNSIESLILTLVPVKIGSVQLQRADITIGDFFGCWWKIRNGLNKANTDLAKAIIDSMIKRQQLLLYNDLFVSAIYLDPRFQLLLATDMKTKAKNHLDKLWHLLQALKARGVYSEIEMNVTEEENSTVELVLPNSDDQDDDFENFLKEKCGLRVVQTVTDPQSFDISSILELFDGTVRISYNSDRREYWISKKYENPELYELAQITLAIPATQVSVERCFSSLKFILGDLHGNLSPSLLESIMIIKCNNQFNAFN